MRPILVIQARSISNRDTRRSLYVQIQRTVLDESPNRWWYAKYDLEALSTKLQGYSQSFTARRTFPKKTWLNG